MDKKALREMCETKAKKGDGSHAIALALIELADAQRKIADALLRLGNGTTSPGAIAILANQIAKLAGKENS